MKYRKVTAIVMSEKLGDIEKALIAMHVSGLSITQVRGYGEYHNFYQKDMMCRHARIEIFCLTSQADAIAKCIMEAAHTGMAGDGVVAILPTEKLYRIRNKSELGADDVV
ncbi:MAG TPA: P-II family nitrogen regulator [Mariprofundaceae bacterium]|nr:P-II family nitrogen regulator [Mariprofundaceae bacterium]